MLKLHFGCGEIHLPNFINFDARATKATDLTGSLEELLDKYPEGFETVYLCHVLEHFPLHKVSDALNCFYRLLTVSGEIYISVPDFEILASIYLAKRVTLGTIVRAIHGGQEYPENTHYISFDTALLSSFLYQAGFRNLSTYLPSDFLPPGIEDTSMYKIGGKYISLNLKASKLS